jgi:hypothetical protein
MTTTHLQPSDLLSLEQYSKMRADMRTKVIEHKKNRTVHIGPNVTWIFEDRLTIQYQIQEMLRVERIFEEQGIRDELNAYNPLIPDGSNWKVTFLVEYLDVEERRQALIKLKDIEHRCWVQVAGFDRVFALADEDMERSNDEKTSAVHFLRFELTPAMCSAAKSGVALNMGVDHPDYQQSLSPVSESVRASLVKDLV